MAMAGQQRDGLRLLLLTGPLSALGSMCVDLYLPALPSISRDLHAGSECDVRARNESSLPSL